MALSAFQLGRVDDRRFTGRESRPDRGPSEPYFGYRFKILSRQGEHAPGGRYDYVINGNMIGGFALLAFPADYGISGVMSFMVSQQGVIYQKDLGEPSVQVGEAIDTFDPDESWEPVPATLATTSSGPWPASSA